MKKERSTGTKRTGQWSDGSKRQEDGCSGVVWASKSDSERTWSESKMMELVILGSRAITVDDHGNGWFK